MSVDPLADKNIATSPYMYCNGNPIILVDPDGRDVWELGDDGQIIHVITDETQDAIRINSQQISFDYGTIVSGSHVDRDRGSTTFVFKQGAETEAASAFKFLADNSMVEYALINTKNDVSSIFTNHSSHNVDCTDYMLAFGAQNSGITSFYHNHPSGGTIPSGFGKRNMRGGDKSAISKLNQNVDSYVYGAKSGLIRQYTQDIYMSDTEEWHYPSKGVITTSDSSWIFKIISFFIY